MALSPLTAARLRGVPQSTAQWEATCGGLGGIYRLILQAGLSDVGLAGAIGWLARQPHEVELSDFSA
jgi:hypothetical protein